MSVIHHSTKYRAKTALSIALSESRGMIRRRTAHFQNLSGYESKETGE